MEDKNENVFMSEDEEEDVASDDDEVVSALGSDVASDVASEAESEVGSEVGSDVDVDVDEDEDKDVEAETDVDEDEDVDVDEGSDDDVESEVDEDVEQEDEEDEETVVKTTKRKSKKPKSSKKLKLSKKSSSASAKGKKQGTTEIKSCGEQENDYFKKFTNSTREAIIANYHPEIIIHNATEVQALTHIVRMEDGTIDDLLHRTLPFLTKFEKTRVLGQRARQLNDGAPICCDPVPDHIIDNYLIAEMELKLKVLPFIIRRPLPNGGSEYWHIKDLELI